MYHGIDAVEFLLFLQDDLLKNKTSPVVQASHRNPLEIEKRDESTFDEILGSEISMFPTFKVKRFLGGLNLGLFNKFRKLGIPGKCLTLESLSFYSKMTSGEKKSCEDGKDLMKEVYEKDFYKDEDCKKVKVVQDYIQKGCKSCLEKCKKAYDNATKIAGSSCGKPAEDYLSCLDNVGFEKECETGPIKENAKKQCNKGTRINVKPLLMVFVITKLFV